MFSFEISNDFPHQLFLFFRASEQKVIVSGVVLKGHPEINPAAIKVAHEKPIPQHEKRPAGAGGKGSAMHIQQPRKQQKFIIQFLEDQQRSG